MPQPWPVTQNFSGAKFAARYGLNRDAFYVREGQLFLQPPAIIPDDPPIFDLNDPPIEIARSGAKKSFAETPDGQLIRALAAVMLNEINILRAAVIPLLPPRTLAQLKTAIIARIDDGTAD